MNSMNVRKSLAIARDRRLGRRQAAAGDRSHHGARSQTKSKTFSRARAGRETITAIRQSNGLGTSIDAKPSHIKPAYLLSNKCGRDSPTPRGLRQNPHYDRGGHKMIIKVDSYDARILGHPATSEPGQRERRLRSLISIGRSRIMDMQENISLRLEGFPPFGIAVLSSKLGNLS